MKRSRAKGILTEYLRNKEKIYQQIIGTMAIKGIKQYQIADELGLHKSTVSIHFENKTFSFEQILQIFEFIGLEITLCAKPF